GRQDGSESQAVAVAMAGRLRELLRDLPPENRASLQYLLRHLRRPASSRLSSSTTAWSSRRSRRRPPGARTSHPTSEPR
ncbi:ARHGAP45 isoform 1, partial [Pan troglodytes]